MFFPLGCYTRGHGHGQATRSDGARRLVAVAGAIAEAVWTGDDPDFYDPATMSPTDWQWAGVEPGDGDTLLDAADIVSGLLQHGSRLWPDLIREARQLMVQARQVGAPEDAEPAQTGA